MYASDWLAIVSTNVSTPAVMSRDPAFCIDMPMTSLSCSLCKQELRGQIHAQHRYLEGQDFSYAYRAHHEPESIQQASGLIICGGPNHILCFKQGKVIQLCKYESNQPRPSVHCPRKLKGPPKQLLKGYNSTNLFQTSARNMLSIVHLQLSTL